MGMNKIRRIKIGIIFILLGIGIPLVLYFFQDDGVVLEIPITKVIERKLTPSEVLTIQSNISKIREDMMLKVKANKINLYIPEGNWLFEKMYGKDYLRKVNWTITKKIEIKISFRKIIGLGIFLIFIGLGLIIFSLFPK